MNQIILALVNSDLLTYAPAFLKLQALIQSGQASVYIGNCGDPDGPPVSCSLNFSVDTSIYGQGPDVVTAIRNAIESAVKTGPLAHNA